MRASQKLMSCMMATILCGGCALGPRDTVRVSSSDTRQSVRSAQLSASNSMGTGRGGANGYRGRGIHSSYSYKRPYSSRERSPFSTIANNARLARQVASKSSVTSKNNVASKSSMAAKPSVASNSPTESVAKSNPGLEQATVQPPKTPGNATASRRFIVPAVEEIDESLIDQQPSFSDTPANWPQPKTSAQSSINPAISPAPQTSRSASSDIAPGPKEDRVSDSNDPGAQTKNIQPKADANPTPKNSPQEKPSQNDKSGDDEGWVNASIEKLNTESASQSPARASIRNLSGGKNARGVKPPIRLQASVTSPAPVRPNIARAKEITPLEANEMNSARPLTAPARSRSLIMEPGNFQGLPALEPVPVPAFANPTAYETTGRLPAQRKSEDNKPIAVAPSPGNMQPVARPRHQWNEIKRLKVKLDQSTSSLPPIVNIVTPPKSAQEMLGGAPGKFRQPIQRLHKSDARADNDIDHARQLDELTRRLQRLEQEAYRNAVKSAPRIEGQVNPSIRRLTVRPESDQPTNNGTIDR